MIRPNFTAAWILLTLSLAIHVLDEALHNFLSFYNPLVTSLNERTGSFFPVFSKAEWLGGLITAIVILFAMTYFVVHRKRWIRYLGAVYAVIMILNGLGHIVGSIYFSEMIGGLYSSPILIVFSFYLLWSIRSQKTRNQ